MATRTISTRLVIEGESAYKSAISNINNNLSTLKSRLSAVQSEYRNNQNSMEALRAKSEALNNVQAEQSKKLETLKSAYKNAESTLNSYKTKVDENKNAISENQQKLDSLSTEVQEAGQEYANCSSKITENNAKLAQLRSTTGDTAEEEAKLEQEIADCQKRMEELNESTDGAASEAAELIQKDKELNSELQKNESYQQQAQKACNNWEKQINNTQIQLDKLDDEIKENDKYLEEAEDSADDCATSIDEYGNKIDDAVDSTDALTGVLTSAGLIAAIKEVAEAFKECIDAAASFESQMSTVEALSGASADEMNSLSAAAKEAGATTSYTATEAGEALEYMALAGWDTSDMLESLDGVLNLAAASSMDLGTASDIVTDYMTAFGLAASDADQFVDQLAYAMSNSNTTTEQLGEAYKNCASTAGSMGYSVSEVTAVLMTMANAGVKGGEAGTALNTVMTRLATDTKGCATELKQYGIEVYDAQGNMNSLSSILEGMSEIWSDLTDEQQANLSKTIAGTNQYSSFQTIMTGVSETAKESGQSFTDYAAALEDCTGSAQEMADTKLDNFTGQVTLLESAWDALLTTIGESAAPTLTEILSIVTDVISAFNDFLVEHPLIADAITGITAAVIAMGVALVAATLYVEGLVSKMLLLMAELVSLAPYIAAIGALVGVITTVIVAYNNTETESKRLKEETEELTEKIKEQKEAYDELSEENKTASRNYKDMANELVNLTNKTDKTVAEQARLESIIDELNEAFPDLALAYDETTDSINMSDEALASYIDTQSEQTKYQADVDRMNELYDEQAEIMAELEEAEAALAEAQGEVGDTAGDAAVAIMGGGTAGMYASAETSALSDAIVELNEALNDVNAELEEVEGSIDDTAAAQADSITQYELGVDAVDDFINELTSLNETYQEAYDEAYESVHGQMDLWDEAVDASADDFAMTSENIMAALESQITYWNEYGDNLENLNNRNIEGLDKFVAAIDDGSTEAAQYIAGMANMSDDELRELMSTYGQLEESQDRVVTDSAQMLTQYTENIQQMVDDAAEQINNLNMSDGAKSAAYETVMGYVSGLVEGGYISEEQAAVLAQTVVDEFEEKCGYAVFYQAGTYSVDGYIDGVAAKTNPLQTTMYSLATDSVEDPFTTTLGINSPSTVFRGYGENTIQGFINGVNRKNSSLLSNMRTLAQNAIENFRKNSTSSSLNSTGSNTIQGYISGASSKSGSANTSMRSYAQNAINAFRNNASSSSLSSAGSDTLQGFINGLNNKTGTLYTKMQSIASTAMSKFKQTLGINSPSKEFALFGEYSGEGYIQGVTEKQTEINQTMQEMAQNAYDSFASEMSVSTGKLSDLTASVQMIYAGSSDDSGAIVQNQGYSGSDLKGYIQSAVAEIMGDKNIDLTINLTSQMDAKQVAKSTIKYTKPLLEEAEKLESYLKGDK